MLNIKISKKQNQKLFQNQLALVDLEYYAFLYNVADHTQVVYFHQYFDLL